MEPDASLFSQTVTSTLLLLYPPLFSVSNVGEQIICHLPNHLFIPPSSVSPSGLIFQLVSMFNKLIHPSLIKHDHRPCEVTHPFPLPVPFFTYQNCMSQLKILLTYLSISLLLPFIIPKSVTFFSSSVPLSWSFLIIHYS